MKTENITMKDCPEPQIPKVTNSMQTYTHLTIEKKIPWRPFAVPLKTKQCGWEQMHHMQGYKYFYFGKQMTNSSSEEKYRFLSSVSKGSNK